MINKKTTLYCLAFVVCSQAFGQKYDYNWIAGMHELPGIQGYNNVVIHFDSNGGYELDTLDLGMNIESTVASMSDAAGNLLFFTNGCYIAGSDGQVLANGDGLNPGKIHDWVCGKTGYVSPRGAMAIPAPGHDHIYYLFHTGSQYDPVRKNVFGPLYYTVVDMSLENGKGAVVSKNNILLEGDLEPFTAVRHGNGRDWWLMIPHYNSNQYDFFLVTPKGIQFRQSSTIGPKMDCKRIGSSVFSSKGNRLARVQNCKVLICNFDRCTGQLSEPLTLNRPTETVGGGGAAFSPDGTKFFVSSQAQVFQADLTASAPQLDTAFAWNLYWGISMQYMQPAPDGRLWINHMHRTNYFTTIDHPEGWGNTLGFQAKGVNLPVFSVRTLPNIPNFRLYDFSESPCDTLGINGPVSSLTAVGAQQGITEYPNPAFDHLTFQTADAFTGPGEIWIWSSMGSLCIKHSFSGQLNGVVLPVDKLAPGIYFWEIHADSRFRKSGKFVKLD